MISRLSQWRTAIAVLLLGLMLLVGLLIAANVPESVVAAIATMYTAFASAIVGLAVVLGGKSSVEHLARGGGVKGAMAALMTKAKPEKPEQPVEPEQKPPEGQP